MDEPISYKKYRQMLLNCNEDMTEDEIAEAWADFCSVKGIDPDEETGSEE